MTQLLQRTIVRLQASEECFKLVCSSISILAEELQSHILGCRACQCRYTDPGHICSCYPSSTAAVSLICTCKSGTLWHGSI